MTNRLIGPLLCGSLLLLAVLTPAAAPAAPTLGACSPTKVKYIASDFHASTTSSTFGNIPEATVGFPQGGANASCVIVRFSALTFAGDNNLLAVRAFLDNATAALPVQVQYSGKDTGYAHSRSFDFIFPNVAPGDHIVRMQFKSTFGGPVNIYNHNTVVQFAP